MNAARRLPGKPMVNKMDGWAKENDDVPAAGSALRSVTGVHGKPT